MESADNAISRFKVKPSDFLPSLFFLYDTIFGPFVKRKLDMKEDLLRKQREETWKKHFRYAEGRLTSPNIYDSIPPEFNIKDDEGNQVFRDDFREPPVAARRYKAGKSLLPELVL